MLEIWRNPSRPAALTLSGHRPAGPPAESERGPGSRTFLIAALFALLAVGCGEAEDADGTRPVGVRDSAGITVVENAAGAIAAAERWSLSERPVVEVGGADGGSDALYAVREGFLRSEGGYVVGNAGHPNIHIYSADGTLHATAGRPGEGPGELRSLQLVDALEADSIVAYDPGLRRFSVFDPGGGFVRSTRLDAPSFAGHPFPQGVWAAKDRTLLGYSRAVGAPGVTGAYLDSATYVATALDGSEVDSIGRFPSSEMVALVEGSSVTGSPVPFGRRAGLALSRTGFWFGASDRWTLEHRSIDGTLQRVVRLERPLRPVTSDALDRMRERRLERVGDQLRPRMERAFELAPRRETMPAYDRIHVAGDGDLWVREYTPPWAESASWIVFAEDGRVRATVETPASFELLDVRGDRALIVRRDELDVEYVGIYSVGQDTDP